VPSFFLIFLKSSSQSDQMSIFSRNLVNAAVSPSKGNDRACKLLPLSLPPERMRFVPVEKVGIPEDKERPLLSFVPFPESDIRHISFFPLREK